jgi:cyanate permease
MDLISGKIKETFNQDAKYKWYLLFLSAFTNTVVAAIPTMGLSVLLPEISKELNLSLVQAGLVWGISSLPVIISGLLAGALGDRFGPRRILILGCLLSGLAGALRGLSVDIISLSVSVFLYGFLTPLIILNNMKSAGMWFSSRELGLANGVLSMGLALGFFMGSMVSATVISPWLGGWRHVFFFYGGLSVIFCISWYFTRSSPNIEGSVGGVSNSKSMFKNVSHVVRIRNLWLMGLAILGISGSYQGLLGYLPLFLRGKGWSVFTADGALAAFHLVSLIFTLPISLRSDKLNTRKRVLIAAGLMTMIGTGLLSVVSGNSIWAAVILAGMVRDGFMAVYMSMVIETDGVGPVYSGTATGFVIMFLGIGNLLAPPIGNRLAGITPGSPFLFWAALNVFGLFCISLATEPEKNLGEQRMAGVS